MELDPAALEDDHCWTYDEEGGNGLLCSEPRRVEGWPLERLRSVLRARAAEAEPLEGHVGRLTSGVDDWRYRPSSISTRWGSAGSWRSPPAGVTLEVLQGESRTPATCGRSALLGRLAIYINSRCYSRITCSENGWRMLLPFR